MKKFLVVLFFILSCSQNVQKDEHALRIISLAPNITEIIYALKGEAFLVGVSDFCNYPPEAKLKESVGGLLNPNLEKITALKPDLILATESYSDLLTRFESTTFKIILLPEKTVSDVFTSVDSIGVITGLNSNAKILHEAIKDSLDKYSKKDDEKVPNAILVLGRDAGSARNIGISGPGAFIDELWRFVGGKNTFADMSGSYVQLNKEYLLKRNPDIIIEFKANKNWTLDKIEANKKEWRDLSKLSAVQSGNIYIIPGNDYVIPGPRIYMLAKEYRQIIKSYTQKMENL